MIAEEMDKVDENPATQDLTNTVSMADNILSTVKN